MPGKQKAEETVPAEKLGTDEAKADQPVSSEPVGQQPADDQPEPETESASKETATNVGIVGQTDDPMKPVWDVNTQAQPVEEHRERYEVVNEPDDATKQYVSPTEEQGQERAEDKAKARSGSTDKAKATSRS